MGPCGRPNCDDGFLLFIGSFDPATGKHLESRELGVDEDQTAAEKAVLEAGHNPVFMTRSCEVCNPRPEAKSPVDPEAEPEVAEERRLVRRLPYVDD